MLQNNEFLLIDHLDQNLSPDESAMVDTLIHSDKQVATEWAYLKMAVEAVELGAIREQVLNVRKSFNGHAAPAANASGAVIRNMYRSGLRIAAILILVLGISIVYKYSTVSNTSIYQQHFTDYTLSTSRGTHDQDALDEAYRNKNWSAVMTVFGAELTKTNKSYFLAGMAAMESHKYAEAVGHFETILAANAKSGDNYFQDEAEYYLALAYLMNHQADKGVNLLNQIRTNKDQVYNPLARQISATDLKIITIKNNK